MYLMNMRAYSPKTMRINEATTPINVNFNHFYLNDELNGNLSVRLYLINLVDEDNNIISDLIIFINKNRNKTNLEGGNKTIF